MIPLTKDQVATLGELATRWPEGRFVLVGASALAFHLPMHWRTTNDVDLTVALGVEDLLADLGAIEGWKQDPRVEQRWWSRHGTKVDLVPASASLLAAGRLVWPRTGAVMDLAGLDLAFEHFIEVPLDEGINLRVARLPVLVLLKMVAWLDRPMERERDLLDLAFVLEDYIDAGDERRYEDDVLAAGLDFASSTAFVLGSDLARIARPSHRSPVERFLAALGNEDGAWHGRMLATGPIAWRNESDDALTRRLDAFRAGWSGAWTMRQG